MKSRHNSRRKWRGGRLTLATGLAVLCVSCAQQLSVDGRYQTSVALLNPAAEWGTSGMARLIGRANWDLRTYMWNQIAKTNATSIHLSLGELSSMSFRCEGDSNTTSAAGAYVVFRIYVRAVDGELKPLLVAPPLPLSRFLQECTLPADCYHPEGTEVLRDALTNQRASLDMLFELAFPTVTSDSLTMQSATLHLNMPWEAYLPPP
jgi:hypothetical protein